MKHGASTAGDGERGHEPSTAKPRAPSTPATPRRPSPIIEGGIPEAEHARARRGARAEKAPYLNLHVLLRFARFSTSSAGCSISRKLFQNSTKQDESGDPALTVSSQRLCAGVHHRLRAHHHVRGLRLADVARALLDLAPSSA